MAKRLLPTRRPMLVDSEDDEHRVHEVSDGGDDEPPRKGFRTEVPGDPERRTLTSWELDDYIRGLDSPDASWLGLRAMVPAEDTPWPIWSPSEIDFLVLHSTHGDRLSERDKELVRLSMSVPKFAGVLIYDAPVGSTGHFVAFTVDVIRTSHRSVVLAATVFDSKFRPNSSDGYSPPARTKAMCMFMNALVATWKKLKPGDQVSIQSYPDPTPRDRSQPEKTRCYTMSDKIRAQYDGHTCGSHAMTNAWFGGTNMFGYDVPVGHPRQAMQRFSQTDIVQRQLPPWLEERVVVPVTPRIARFFDDSQCPESGAGVVLDNPTTAPFKHPQKLLHEGSTEATAADMMMGPIPSYAQPGDAGPGDNFILWKYLRQSNLQERGARLGHLRCLYDHLYGENLYRIDLHPLATLLGDDIPTGSISPWCRNLLERLWSTWAFSAFLRDWVICLRKPLKAFCSDDRTSGPVDHAQKGRRPIICIQSTTSHQTPLWREAVTNGMMNTNRCTIKAEGSEAYAFKGGVRLFVTPSSFAQYGQSPVRLDALGYSLPQVQSNGQARFKPGSPVQFSRWVIDIGLPIILLRKQDMPFKYVLRRYMQEPFRPFWAYPPGDGHRPRPTYDGDHDPQLIVSIGDPLVCDSNPEHDWRRHDHTLGGPKESHVILRAENNGFGRIRANVILDRLDERHRPCGNPESTALLVLRMQTLIRQAIPQMIQDMVGQETFGQDFEFLSPDAEKQYRGEFEKAPSIWSEFFKCRANPKGWKYEPEHPTISSPVHLETAAPPEVPESLFPSWTIPMSTVVAINVGDGYVLSGNSSKNKKSTFDDALRIEASRFELVGTHAYGPSTYVQPGTVFGRTCCRANFRDVHSLQQAVTEPEFWTHEWNEFLQSQGFKDRKPIEPATTHAGYVYQLLEVPDNCFNRAVRLVKEDLHRKIDVVSEQYEDEFRDYVLEALQEHVRFVDPVQFKGFTLGFPYGTKFAVEAIPPRRGAYPFMTFTLVDQSDTKSFAEKVRDRFAKYVSPVDTQTTARHAAFRMITDGLCVPMFVEVAMSSQWELSSVAPKFSWFPVYECQVFTWGQMFYRALKTFVYEVLSATCQCYFPTGGGGPRTIADMYHKTIGKWPELVVFDGDEEGPDVRVAGNSTLFHKPVRTGALMEYKTYARSDISRLPLSFVHALWDRRSSTGIVSGELGKNASVYAPESVCLKDMKIGASQAAVFSYLRLASVVNEGGTRIPTATYTHTPLHTASDVFQGPVVLDEENFEGFTLMFNNAVLAACVPCIAVVSSAGISKGVSTSGRLTFIDTTTPVECVAHTLFDRSSKSRAKIDVELAVRITHPLGIWWNAMLTWMCSQVYFGSGSPSSWKTIGAAGEVVEKDVYDAARNDLLLGPSNTIWLNISGIGNPRVYSFQAVRSVLRLQTLVSIGDGAKSVNQLYRSIEPLFDRLPLQLHELADLIDAILKFCTDTAIIAEMDELGISGVYDAYIPKHEGITGRPIHRMFNRVFTTVLSGRDETGRHAAFRNWSNAYSIGHPTVREGGAYKHDYWLPQTALWAGMACVLGVGEHAAAFQFHRMQARTVVCDRTADVRCHIDVQRRGDDRYINATTPFVTQTLHLREPTGRPWRAGSPQRLQAAGLYVWASIMRTLIGICMLRSDLIPNEDLFKIITFGDYDYRSAIKTVRDVLGIPEPPPAGQLDEFIRVLSWYPGAIARPGCESSRPIQAEEVVAVSQWLGTARGGSSRKVEPWTPDTTTWPHRPMFQPALRAISASIQLYELV